MSDPAGGIGIKRPLEGRTALVTGASRGIGRATALGLARAGARVGLVARSRDVLEELARETGGWALPGDVSRFKEVEGVLARFGEAAGGPPDLVVTAAGVFSLSPAHGFSPGELEASLAVNLKGTLQVVREVLPGMLERGSGTLILVGSVAGRKALSGNAVYSAAKFGVRGFHEVLLEELRGTGVRATLLEPAATDTPLWDPLDPDRDPNLPDRAAMLRPEELAEAVVWVAGRPENVQVPFLPMEGC
jgi:NADP-dependent 3-hydroxy acid dehydrogenase YdfG